MTTQTTSLPASTGPSEPRPNAGLRTSLRILAVALSLLGVAAGALNVASMLARATEHRDATYQGVRAIQLDLAFESVQIVGVADATSVSMTRSYTWSLQRPNISSRLDGDLLSMSSSCPVPIGLGCSGHVRLVVPKDLEIRVHSSDGSIEVGVPSDGTSYDVTATTSDGSRDVSVPSDPKSAHRIQLGTSDGSIRVVNQ
jgi:hypothetical protein